MDAAAWTVVPNQQDVAANQSVVYAGKNVMDEEGKVKMYLVLCKRQD